MLRACKNVTANESQPYVDKMNKKWKNKRVSKGNIFDKIIFIPEILLVQFDLILIRER